MQRTSERSNSSLSRLDADQPKGFLALISEPVNLLQATETISKLGRRFGRTKEHDIEALAEIAEDVCEEGWTTEELEFACKNLRKNFGYRDFNFIDLERAKNEQPKIYTPAQVSELEIAKRNSLIWVLDVRKPDRIVCTDSPLNLLPHGWREATQQELISRRQSTPTESKREEQTPEQKAKWDQLSAKLRALADSEEQSPVEALKRKKEMAV